MPFLNLAVIKVIYPGPEFPPSQIIPFPFSLIGFLLKNYIHVRFIVFSVLDKVNKIMEEVYQIKW